MDRSFVMAQTTCSWFNFIDCRHTFTKVAEAAGAGASSIIVLANTTNAVVAMVIVESEEVRIDSVIVAIPRL